MNSNEHLEKPRSLDGALSTFLPIGMGLFGIMAMMISTNQGPGIGGDATIYIKSAENFIHGNGLGLVGPQGEFRLLPYFPPFFSLVISMLGIFGFDLVEGTHWLNMILFGGLITLAGWSTIRITKSWQLSLLFMFFILASPVLIPIYSWAMSEPLCLFLGFLGLVMLYEALGKEETGIVFYGSAVATGLSFLTRYSAAAFIGAGVLGWLLLRSSTWRVRLRDMLAYVLTAGLPMVIWVIYDISQTTTLASRSIENAAEIAWRFGNLWPSLEEVILFWVIPNSWVFTPKYDPRLNHILFIIVATLFFTWFYIVGKKLLTCLDDEYYRNHYRFGVILLTFSLSYLAIISIVYIFTFPPITIYHRMLSPLHVAIMWLVTLLISVTFQLMPHQQKWIKLISMTLVFMVVWYGWRTTRIVQQNYAVGFGYTAPDWRSSETINQVRDLSKDTLIITNEQNAVLFLTDRPAYPMKEIYRVEPLSVFFSFGQGDLESDETQRMFREGAALVLFNSIQRQMGDLYGDLADDRIQKLTEGLYKAYEGKDGSIYYIDEQASLQ